MSSPKFRMVFQQENSLALFKYITLILLMITTIGCSHYIINDAGYVRPPKNYKFSYRNQVQNLVSNVQIDTTVVYYLNNCNVYRTSDEYKYRDHYIRFYADGKFKVQGVKEFPKIEDVNNINLGIVGYYKLKGNVIKMQTYTDIEAGSDQLEFGLIDENKNLILLSDNPRSTFGIGYSESGIKRKIQNQNIMKPKRYKKVKIEKMIYKEPNW